MKGDVTTISDRTNAYTIYRSKVIQYNTDTEASSWPGTKCPRTHMRKFGSSAHWLTMIGKSPLLACFTLTDIMAFLIQLIMGLFTRPFNVHFSMKKL